MICLSWLVFIQYTICVHNKSLCRDWHAEQCKAGCAAAKYCHVLSVLLQKRAILIQDKVILELSMVRHGLYFLFFSFFQLSWATPQSFHVLPGTVIAEVPYGIQVPLGGNHCTRLHNDLLVRRWWLWLSFVGLVSNFRFKSFLILQNVAVISVFVVWILMIHNTVILKWLDQTMGHFKSIHLLRRPI